MGAAKTISNFTAAAAATFIGKSGTTYLNAKLAEVLVYEGTVSATDRKTIYDKLTSYYGISLNNPSPSASSVTAKIGSTNISNGTQLIQPAGQVVFLSPRQMIVALQK